LTLYLSIDQVEELHALQLRHYGGSPRLRDPGALESAVARPAMTFGGEDLYPDHASKATALMHSLVMSHSYVDGNKRVGAHTAILFLRMNGQRLEMTSTELEDLTVTVAKGELDAEALVIWFRQRISRED
jgi:death-on-curing protein